MNFKCWIFRPAVERFFCGLGLAAALTVAAHLQAAPSPIGTGLLSNISLGPLVDPSQVNRAWPGTINYDVSLSTWKYDVYVPPGYDGTKPYGVVVYTSSNSAGAVLSQVATDRNLIWIAPRNVQNNAYQPDRYGASLLAFYRAKELFNIDSRRVYISGLSGGARIASALAFFHSELIKGTAPSSGFGLPRLNAVTPNYIPNTSSNPESYFDYADAAFISGQSALNATAKANKLRTYLITRYGDHREDYFVEAFHCAYEPQGLTTFLYDGPGGHQDASDAEMRDAIDYLDRDDTFPIDANSGNNFANLTDISQSGAQAATIAGSPSVKRLTPSLSAVAAVKSATNVYWDTRNGSTFRWLWEVKAASPQNQKTTFGVWFTGETWAGGPPDSLTAGSNPGILVTITQTAAGNRIVLSARPDTGGATVFYDGSFSFVPAYSTAQTSTQTGYLTGTGSPVEMRLELNEKRFVIFFNGITLGTTNSIASGTEVSPDNRRSLMGTWDSALGRAFWKHDPNTSFSNTWSPFTKAIFTAATGAASGSGAVPSALDLRYVLVSNPTVPVPLPPGPTGFTAVANSGKIQLAWKALAEATSYEVKRSTVPGGTTTTLQSNLSGTAYADTSATVGTTYYYAVSANTPSGSTANSTAVATGLNRVLVRSTGGGAPSASSQNSTENAAAAFDGATSTKWNNAGGATGWLQYRFGANQRWVITTYKLTSANDTPTRDPKDWQVLGSNDGVNWTVLDTQTGQTFANRFQTNTYTVATPGEYAYYRLNITLNNGATSIQLSEWQLSGADLIPPVITTPANITVAATSPAGAVVTFTVIANDTGDGVVDAKCTPASGSTFPIGITIVNCTASDLSGNASQKSFTVTVTGPPAAPTGLTVTPGDGRVDLSWSPSSGATAYSILRSTSSASGYSLLVSGLTATSYADLTATNGTTWYYTISASNAAGTGTASAASNTTPIGAAQIVTPHITFASGEAQISLATSISGRNYQLQRSFSLASGSWINLGPAKAGGAALSFTDTPDASQPKAFYRLLIDP